ncbi:MAG: hypothetical protein KAH32_06320 [Chlamydiia bacterium]|nr:hypothetical protein [Chlamydiia bacterium]
MEMISNNTAGLTNNQIAGGTPSQKVITLKAFFKDDKCIISPAKDGNGRYVGIEENLSEMEKLKRGYHPTIDSRIRIYDGLEINLNDQTWAADWEWMKHTREISDSFAEGQETPGAYFYIYRQGFESAKNVADARKLHALKEYIFNDTPENLYNRVKILGISMDDFTIADVQEYLLGLVETDPASLRNVYENDLFALELLLMHALEKQIVTRRAGSYIFGEVYLGIDKRAVLSYFSNPRNTSITSTIEGAVYGNKINKSLEDELVAAEDLDFSESIKSPSLKPNTDALDRLTAARSIADKKKKIKTKK